MKTQLPDFETTPMTELIKERIQGDDDRRVVHDWLVRKLTYAELGAKYNMSIAKVGRILRRARARLFR